MKNSVQVLTQMFDLLPDAVLIVNNEGVIVECNHRTFALLGYQPAELRGQSLDILIPEHLRFRHKEHMHTYSTDKQPRRMGEGRRLMARKKEGMEIEVDIALAPLHEEGKSFTLAVVRDISDRLELDRRIGSLQKMKDELEKFAMVVSHDLKSPLQRVKMLIHLITLELSSAQNEQIKQLVEYLNGSIATMEDLIHGILDYAKAEGEDNGTIIDLNEVLKDVKDNIVLPENFQIEAKPLPKIVGNYTKVFQVFLNLVTNAVKYNNRPKGILRIDWTEDNNQYRFCFQDNGIVVPVEKREDIFKLFNRAQEGNTNSTSHGVGLSIVKKIIDQAGGNIWYEESALGGSCFTFYWPRK